MDEDQQTTEVRDTTTQQGDTRVNRQVVSRDTAVSGRTVAVRIWWFIIGVIITLLAIRMILLLLAANQGNAFVDFVYSLSGVFAAPFFGIFSYTPVYGNSVFEVSSLVAIIVYGLIGVGVAKLLTINSTVQE